LKACAAVCGLYLVAPMINRGRFQVFAQDRAEYSGRAIDLVADALVIDMLSALGVVGKRWERWIDGPAGFTRADAEAMRSSGVTVFHLAGTTAGAKAGDHAYRDFARLNSLVLYHGDYLMRIASADDFERAKREDKAGLLLGTQNSEHFDKVEDVDAFWRLGQRVSQLTHNDGNRLGSGGMARFETGLTEYGAAIVERMNKVGMTVDVAHCDDRTTLDAIEASSKPIAVTHSNARALNPGYARCKTDEAIGKMARKGGVMGLTVMRAFVRGADPTTTAHWLDHVDHVARLVGIEHVGIGTDADVFLSSRQEEMDWYETLPKKIKKFYRFRTGFGIDGLDHPKRVFDITEGLIRRGYSDADIRAVLGLNFKRLLSETWA
jgi:membrane dipeptidase